jgi:hypothetical protein
MSTFSTTQLLSGIIKKEGFPKKEIDFLLFKADFAYQSNFATPSQLSHKSQKKK